MHGEKKQGNSTPQKLKNSIEDLVGNEENEHPVPDAKRIMINMTTELHDVHKEFLKKEIMNEFIEVLMEKLQENVKENIKSNSKNIKTSQLKNLKRHRNN
jgi:predicted transcriptional regulator